MHLSRFTNRTLFHKNYPEDKDEQKKRENALIRFWLFTSRLSAKFQYHINKHISFAISLTTIMQNELSRQKQSNRNLLDLVII